MYQTEQQYLDSVALHAMTALIAKTPVISTNDTSIDVVSNHHAMVANGAYSYAVHMLNARNKLVEATSEVQVVFDPVPEFSYSEGEFNPVHDYEGKTPLFTLHGRPVFEDTILLTIYNPSLGETFEKDGVEITLHETDGLDTPYGHLVHSSAFEKFYIVKPELFLHGVPVYADTILETRFEPDDHFDQEVIANAIDIDTELEGTPIQCLKSDYKFYSDFYRVKQ